MKFSTYTLLISASAAIKMQSMQEEQVEEQVKCEWKDMACMGVEVPEGQTDMCLILMNEEDCNKGPKSEETEVVGEETEDKLDDKEMQAGTEEDMTKDDQQENIEAGAEDVKKEDEKPIEEVAGAEHETKQEDEVAKDEKLEEEQTGKEEEMPKEETNEEDK